MRVPVRSKTRVCLPGQLATTTALGQTTLLPTRFKALIHTYVSIFANVAFTMRFELSSTRKQIFHSLKLELLKNSFQGDDFQKTSLFVYTGNRGFWLVPFV